MPKCFPKDLHCIMEKMLWTQYSTFIFVWLVIKSVGHQDSYKTSHDKFQVGMGGGVGRGGGSFHFREVYEKCIEYIKIFIHLREISKFW